MSSRFVRFGTACMICCLTTLSVPRKGLAQWNPNQIQPATALSQSVLIQPAELVKALQFSKTKPVVLNVGPKMLYQQAHIPGAEFIGPGSDSESIKQLRARVQSLPHSTVIVLYCGCCPWAHCPNVTPAYTELRRMGFINVKVLYIADNLGTDWVYKGYLTVRGNN
ncbi:MAG: rhodanese-like domain-containing protein [Candidatus Korobacteraceae bacterium]